jgi:hypothetical protein
MSSKNRQEIRAEYNGGRKYPWEITGWTNVSGLTVGDLFSEEVFDILVPAWEEDGIVVKLTFEKEDRDE